MKRKFIPKLVAVHYLIIVHSIFQNRWEQLCYVAVNGESSVDLKMTNLIMLTFDLVMTENEFFGSDLRNNLAIFFGIPGDKVCVASSQTMSIFYRKSKKVHETGRPDEWTELILLFRRQRKRKGEKT